MPLTVTIECDFIAHASPKLTRSYPVTSLELRMTTAQMREGFGEFLRHVTPIELDAWLEEFCPEVIRDAVRQAKEGESHV